MGVKAFILWLTLISVFPLKVVAIYSQKDGHCLETSQHLPRVTCGDVFAPPLWPPIEVCMGLPLCEMLILVVLGGVDEYRSRWSGGKVRMMSYSCETV